jgi:cellulose synthase/poly-beta-1,6-N-acetylglucosamine synthase-like glycosyltransferase
MEFLFWLSVLLVFHSYILFPLILRLLSVNKKANQILYSKDEILPPVSVVMSAYNEEKVIRQKLESLLNSDYPKDKLEIWIGSDNSTDQTNDILKDYASEYSIVKPVLFEIRQGKANIINQLAVLAKGEVLVLTDANVYFTEDTIFNLVKHFKNHVIDLVGGNILNTNIKKTGISFQEMTYLVNENKIKYYEGILWGSMMGAFGGCYAIRKDKYAPVPKNFYMDDFYITMNVLANGGKAINELEAICHEDVSNLVYEEFRRKMRISIGNFQNLSTYKQMLWPPFNGIAFSFLSHKVLRWFTPIFIITAWLSNLILVEHNLLYQTLFILQSILLLIPAIDYTLRSINVHNMILRFISHFYLMNLTLLIGMFVYLKGVKTNVWQPTKRNQ